MADEVERARELMAEAVEAIGPIETYTCVIHCHERMRGKERKPESIYSRFRKPRSVYLRWQKGPYEGLQASHVPDRDGPDRFQARETGLKGLAGATSWAHDSPVIDKLYPHHFRTHETSLLFLLALSAEIQGKAEAMGKLAIEGLEEEVDPILKRPATRLDCRLSDDPRDGLRWLRTRFWFDRETRLPLHFELRDFDGGLSGEYAFTDLVSNARLGPDAFDLRKL